ncbi:MAG TPA: glycosyltransferase [Candidatus Acidoferrales bacterium]|nr:glycosyltransferase [Candidatus Acidoferrales bacterium]
MRIAMLLSLGVSWSREAALRLTELGHEVHAIDFESELNGNYLQGRDDLHAMAVAKLTRAVAGVHMIPGKDISQWRYLRYAPRLRKICKDIHADVLLSLWGGGFAMISCASGIRPYAVFLGGGDILRVSGMQKMLSRYALNQAAVSFANGQYFGERAKAFAPNALIHPIYLGVDTNKFVPGAPPASPVVIICTRGFLPVYNNRYLIEALAQLPESLPDFRVIFTSAGQSLNETRDLSDRILTPAMRQRVQFLNGVTDEGMLANLRGAHIYTSLSRYDGTSISLLEALSCGLFPILSDIPQNREWIDPQIRNGMLVPLDQPARYAEQLAQAIRNETHRKSVAAFNREFILQRADGRKTMAQVAKLLKEAIGSRSNN